MTQPSEDLRREIAEIRSGLTALQERLEKAELLLAPPTGRPHPQPKPEPSPEPEPKPDPRPESGPEPKPEPQPEPAPQPYKDPFTDLIDRLDPGKVLAWVGALIVVCGLGFLVSLGISRGIIGPGSRTVMAGVISLILGAAGYWAVEYKKQGVAGQALVATGGAGLFGTLLATSSLYGFFSPLVAGVLSLICGAAIVFLAWRWDSQVLAVVGFGGSLIAPVLTGADYRDASTAALLVVAYLGSSAVCARRPWPYLTFFNLVLLLPQLFAWAENNVEGVQASAIAVVLVYTLVWIATIWALAWPSLQNYWSSAAVSLAGLSMIVPLSALLAARDFSTLETVWPLLFALGGIASVAAFNRLSRELPVTFSGGVLALSSFAIAFSLGTVIDGPALVGAWAVEASVIAFLNYRRGLISFRLIVVALLGVMAVHLLAVEFGELFSEGTISESNDQVFGLLFFSAASFVWWFCESKAWRIAAWALGVVSLTLAAIVLFDGLLLLGVLAAAAAALSYLNSRDHSAQLRFTIVGLLVVLGLHLSIVDFGDFLTYGTLGDRLEQSVALLLLSAASLCWWHFEVKEWREIAWWLAALSLALSSLVVFDGGVVLPAVWASAAVLLALRERMIASALLLALGLIFSLVWSPPDGLWDPSEDLATAWFSFAPLVLGAAMVSRIREGEDDSRIWGIASAATMLYLGSLTVVSIAGFESGSPQSGQLPPVYRAQVALSVFWTLCGLGTVVYGLRSRSALVRRIGLGLLAVAVVKLLLIDLTTLDAAARTVSFIVVGLIVLAAAFAYRNISARVYEEPSVPDSKDAD